MEPSSSMLATCWILSPIFVSIQLLTTISPFCKASTILLTRKLWKFLARHVIWMIFIGCAWCNLLYRRIFINMAVWISADEKHSLTAPEMKCLKMKLPNHFSVYVTNEKWPKDCCNKWDSHFYKIWLNTLTWKRIYYKEAERNVITTRIASQLASMIYQDKNTARPAQHEWK